MELRTSCLYTKTNVPQMEPILLHVLLWMDGDGRRERGVRNESEELTDK